METTVEFNEKETEIEKHSDTKQGRNRGKKEQTRE